jgi:dUTP pyrophosphatase
MIKTQLQGKEQQVSINAMIDSGATEDFIDEKFCDKYQIKKTKAETKREIYLADGRPSAMGPVTHTAKVPMTIGSHRELAFFQVAKLPNHEVILGMPWLKNHSPRIDWEQGKITFESDRCTTWCLNESPTVYAIPEEEAREENLKVEFGATRDNNDQRIKVKKLTPEARIPTRESTKAAGHDLYANEDKEILPGKQEVVGTGISITPPDGTYGRIAPRSGMAVKHQIAVNAGVIDADYTGEIKVVLVNQGLEPYQVKKGERIAQLVVEKIATSECYEVPNLEETERGTKGFGSTGISKDIHLRNQRRSVRQILPTTRHDNWNPQIR